MEKGFDRNRPDKLRYVILTTGSRIYDTVEEEERIITALKPYVGSDVVLIHGACHLGGADLLCQQFGEFNDWQVIGMPAEDFGPWPACGPLRNSAMVVRTKLIGGQEKRAMRCEAFPRPDSKGTFDCAWKADHAGILTTFHPKESSTWRKQTRHVSA